MRFFVFDLSDQGHSAATLRVDIIGHCAIFITLAGAPMT
jgi:hypothetical protein